jgi:SAM-dependent methyltransferase
MPVPPAQLHLHGIECNGRIARRAKIALGSRAMIHTMDLREATLPVADVILLIDVLHYLEAAAQLALLEKIARSLCHGGLLVLRIADSGAGWRFHLGRMADRFGLPMHKRVFARHHHRPLADWLRLLDSLGFSAVTEAGGAGETFANKLIWADTAPASRVESRRTLAAQQAG